MKDLLIALVLAGLAGCLPMGQKLLTLEVEQESRVLLSTTFDSDDTSSTAELWESAGEVPFSTQVDALQPSKLDPLTAEIVGPVQIRILWTDTEESVVTLDGLQLVRSASGSDDWRMPPAEIARAKTAAGL